MTAFRLNPRHEFRHLHKRIEETRRDLEDAVSQGRINSAEAQRLSNRLDDLILRYTKLQQSLNGHQQSLHRDSSPDSQD